MKLVFVNENSSSSRGCNKKDLHEGVVIADKVGEEVQVAADEDQQVQELGLAGDNRTTSSFPNL